MKSITHLLTLLLVICLTASCSKDDDDGGNNAFSSKIVGKWKYVAQGELDDDGTFISNGYENNPNCLDYTLFDSGKTGEDVLHNLSCDNSEVEVFEWMLSGSTLSLELVGGQIYEYEVLVLSDNTLELVRSNTYVTIFERME